MTHEVEAERARVLSKYKQAVAQCRELELKNDELNAKVNSQAHQSPRTPKAEVRKRMTALKSQLDKAQVIGDGQFAWIFSSLRSLSKPSEQALTRHIRIRR